MIKSSCGDAAAFFALTLATILKGEGKLIPIGGMAGEKYQFKRKISF